MVRIEIQVSLRLYLIKDILTMRRSRVLTTQERSTPLIALK